MVIKSHYPTIDWTWWLNTVCDCHQWDRTAGMDFPPSTMWV